MVRRSNVHMHPRLPLSVVVLAVEALLRIYPIRSRLDNVEMAPEEIAAFPDVDDVPGYLRIRNAIVGRHWRIFPPHPFLPRMADLCFPCLYPFPCPTPRPIPPPGSRSLFLLMLLAW